MCSSDSSSSEKSEKPKSMVSSLKNFLTNTDEVDDDGSNEKAIQPKQELQLKLKPKLKPKRTKNENQVNVKESNLKPSIKPSGHKEDPWFSDFDDSSFSSTSAGSKPTKPADTKPESLKADVEVKQVSKEIKPNTNELKLSATNTKSTKIDIAGKENGDKNKPLHGNTENVKHDNGGNKSNGKNKSSRRKKTSGSKSMKDDSGSWVSLGSLSTSDGDKVKSSQKSKIKSPSNTVKNLKASVLASSFGSGSDGSEFEDF